MRQIRRITNKTITLAIVLTLAIALLFGGFAYAVMARADETNDTQEYVATSLGVSNPDFSETSGSFDPTASPTSWTGASVGGGSGDGLVAGVVDLTPNQYLHDKGGNEALGLDQYPEYALDNVIPQTVFGSDSLLKKGDKKTLFINTPGNMEVVYAYNSTEMSFAANSFYRVSVWVKTGDFAESTGATVKLSGLGVNCSFININTVKDIATDGNGAAVLNNANKYGWKQYKFYVRTSSALTKTVTLTLGIGDAVNPDESGELDVMPRAAHGYAFFDYVEADRISAYDYAFETSSFKSNGQDGRYTNASGTALALDLYDTEYLTTEKNGGTVEIGTFSDMSLADGYWNPNVAYSNSSDSDPVYSKSAKVEIYNSEKRIIDFDDKSVSLTKNPWAPLGKAEYEANAGDSFYAGSDGNILMISALNGAAARGVGSPDVTIERFKYYRFAVWVKGDGIEDGNGITVLVKGENNDPSADNILMQSYTSLSGDADDKAHYGWKEQIVYIKGSTYKDLTVHFELWLGSPDSPSSGIAMFDNVTFTELSRADYDAMSKADSGNQLSLDATLDSTGVTNGNFDTIGSYDKLDYPLPADGWNFHTAETVTVNGNFDHSAVNTDSVVYGIIPADKDRFDIISATGKLTGVNNPGNFASPSKYNALLLSSTEKTAVCYQSSSITAAVDKGYKLTVEMAVDGVSEDGYGASLVLKTTDGNVLSTIEGIKTTNNAFRTYTFYIDAPLSEKTLYVEIWLGLNNRIGAAKKLSDGNVYVKKVAMTEWTVDENSKVSDEYAKVLADYKTAVSSSDSLANLDYGVVSFNSPSLEYFDVYSYDLNDGYGVPYNWTVSPSVADAFKGGIVDIDNNKSGLLYPGFEKKDQSGRMLYIYNTDKNRTVYSYDNTVSLVANTYFKLDVTLKVKVSDEVRKDKTSIGAGINLTGTKTESFENIKDTTELQMQGNESSRDYETFKTYTFYIASGSNGGEIGLNISFGGTDSKNYIQGSLVVSDISLTSINSTTYDDAVKSLNKYEKAVELSAAESDDDKSDEEQAQSEIAWWIIPTVIFSVCLVAAIIIIIVIRIRDKVKKNKKTTYSSEYDRASAMKDLEKLAEADKAEKTENSNKAYSDIDDGDNNNAESNADAEESDEQAEAEEADAEGNDVAEEVKSDDSAAEQNNDAPKSDVKSPADDLDD